MMAPTRWPDAAAALHRLVRDNPVSLSLAVGVAGMGAWRMLTEWTFVVFGFALAGLLWRRPVLRRHLPDAPLRTWWLLSVAFAALSALVTVLALGSARQLHPTWFLLFLPPLVWAMSTEPRARQLLVLAAVAGSAVIAVMAAVQVFSAPEALGPMNRAAGAWGRATAFGITAALLGTACLLAWTDARPALPPQATAAQGSALSAERTRLDDWMSWLSVAGVLCAGLAVAFSFSRGPLLALSGCLMVVVWVWWSRLARPGRIALAVGTGLALVLLVLWFMPAISRGIDDLWAYFSQGKLATSEGERLSAWSSTWSLLSSAPSVPWIGLGHGHLDAALRAGFEGQGARHFVTRMPHMHNDWLDVLVMRGAPALALFLALQWAALRWLARAERERAGAVSGTVALALSYGLMAAVDAPYMWEGCALVLACAMGIIAAPRGQAQPLQAR